MGKKQMAMRTPPKKTMEYEKKARGKQAMQKGKEKVKTGVSFREPMETDEREDSDASEDISEDTEDSGEEGGSGDEGVSDEEGCSDKEEKVDSAEDEKEGSAEEEGSGDGDLAKVLNKVVKMAAALGAKKISKEERSTANVSQKMKGVAEKSKNIEDGQSSKRKLPGGVVVVKRKRQRKKGTKLKGVKGHGSPAALHYVIQHLSTEQRKVVEEIGFGGLLELRASKFIHTMVGWLLVRYDTHTRLLLFNRLVHFSISKHDVYDVFMLPQ
ncbi:uncharacterized protein LOC141591235 [Silene latifolia]|uniref:uncharacterized protein LOC141591235 n=1 Tax=Silene latifolia TaxID=37657 RepID=UPI003D779985